MALIKAAYRHRAMELHPDRNKAPSATAEFQLLTLAYGVLSDSNQRAAYDTGAAVVEPERSGDARSSTDPQSHEPIACSVCSQITAQPRYVVFWEVKSFIFLTHRSPIQGIFCPACAEKKSLRASGITWLLGWWGIPWGPIYSIRAILSNLVGGDKPALINARILTYQAIAFGLKGQSTIAVSIALDALQFAKNTPNSEPSRDSLTSTLDNICKSAMPNTPVMVNRWRLFTRPFYVQAGLLVVAIGTMVITFNSGQDSRPSASYIAAAPASSGIGPHRNRAESKPEYVRPTTAPNGVPWPITAGYMSHYKKKNMSGLSTITVDNTRSDSDAYVKLVSIKGDAATTVRRFYIPAFGQFTAAKLTKGIYRIEYEDLNTGRKYRAESFEAQEIQEPDGIQYSTDTLTLYKVLNGNANVTEMDDADFDAGTSDEVDTGVPLVRP